MFKENLSPKSLQILALAKKEAQGLKNSSAGTEHLLLGLLDDPSEGIITILTKYGVPIKELKEAVYDCIGQGDDTVKFDKIFFTPRADKVIERAMLHAHNLNLKKTAPEHIFFSLLSESDGMAFSVLQNLGVDAQEILQDFKTIVPGVLKEEPQVNQLTPNSFAVTKFTRKKLASRTLNQFGIDLTQLAIEKKLDPTIGRVKEIEEIIEILCQKGKNNPMLIGQPGTGKAQPLYSKVLTVNGWKEMGDITINDRVITPDGNIANVIGIFPQGKQQLVKLTFFTGEKLNVVRSIYGKRFL